MNYDLGGYSFSPSPGSSMYIECKLGVNDVEWTFEERVDESYCGETTSENNFVGGESGGELINAIDYAFNMGECITDSQQVISMIKKLADGEAFLLEIEADHKRQENERRQRQEKEEKKKAEEDIRWAAKKQVAFLRSREVILTKEEFLCGSGWSHDHISRAAAKGDLELLGVIKSMKGELRLDHWKEACKAKDMRMVDSFVQVFGPNAELHGDLVWVNARPVDYPITIAIKESFEEAGLYLVEAGVELSNLRASTRSMISHPDLVEMARENGLNELAEAIRASRKYHDRSSSETLP